MSVLMALRTLELVELHLTHVLVPAPILMHELQTCYILRHLPVAPKNDIGPIDMGVAKIRDPNIDTPKE